MDVVVVVRKMQTRLSALGHKRTCAVQKAMSALLPIAPGLFVEGDERHLVLVVEMAELINLLGTELGNARKKRSRGSSALTSAKKSRYNAVSSGRGRISTRSPHRVVSCPSFKPKSPLSGISATGAVHTAEWLITMLERG
jgi:hypothetical protein